MSPTEAMVQEILERSAHAGRDKLGHLAYQMARTCLSKAEGVALTNTRWFEKPRSVDELIRDFGQLQGRTGISCEASELPLAAPTRDSALKAAQACIRVAVSIEGETTRVQHVRALAARIEGDLEQAEFLVMRLLELPMARRWIAFTLESRQAALLRQGRFSDVVDLGRGMERHGPVSLSNAFNMAEAHAWLDDSAEFDRCCMLFSKSTEKFEDRPWWEGLLATEAPKIAAQLHRDLGEVMAKLALPAHRVGGLR